MNFKDQTSQNASQEWVSEGRRLIKYEDLNSQGTLYGGRLAQWIDDMACIYCICQMKTKRIVTLRISELLFKHPVELYDVLEFRCRTVKEGTTSLTVETEVRTILIGESKIVCTAELQFVALDEARRAMPWKKE